MRPIVEAADGSFSIVHSRSGEVYYRLYGAHLHKYLIEHLSGLYYSEYSSREADVNLLEIYVNNREGHHEAFVGRMVEVLSGLQGGSRKAQLLAYGDGTSDGPTRKRYDRFVEAYNEALNYYRQSDIENGVYYTLFAEHALEEFEETEKWSSVLSRPLKDMALL